TMKAAIMVFEWPGSRPCSAPRKMALGMNSQACAAPCESRSANGVILEILCDIFEFVYGAATFLRKRTDCLFQTMIEMILDEGALGLGNRLFDRVKLLGHIEARPPALNHLDHLLQVPGRSLETFDDFGMCFM